MPRRRLRSGVADRRPIREAVPRHAASIRSTGALEAQLVGPELPEDRDIRSTGALAAHVGTVAPTSCCDRCRRRGSRRRLHSGEPGNRPQALAIVTNTADRRPDDSTLTNTADRRPGDSAVINAASAECLRVDRRIHAGTNRHDRVTDAPGGTAADRHTDANSVGGNRRFRLLGPPGQCARARRELAPRVPGKPGPASSNNPLLLGIRRAAAPGTPRRQRFRRDRCHGGIPTPLPGAVPHSKRPADCRIRRQRRRLHGGG